ncbi:MAG: ORF6N domain-containing protein [Bacillus sp. (in: Bacteria)]|nr:ORF6N domain-containing protein [Bacillus sp. (in: firmicutes)]
MGQIETLKGGTMTDEKPENIVNQENKGISDSNILECTIRNLIYVVRGEPIMLDRDLAMLYQVETKYLNKAVKRNMNRFPEDFCFQLTGEEYDSLRCQFGTLLF